MCSIKPLQGHNQLSQVNKHQPTDTDGRKTTSIVIFLKVGIWLTFRKALNIKLRLIVRAVVLVMSWTASGPPMIHWAFPWLCHHPHKLYIIEVYQVYTQVSVLLSITFSFFFLFSRLKSLTCWLLCLVFSPPRLKQIIFYKLVLMKVSSFIARRWAFWACKLNIWTDLQQTVLTCDKLEYKWIITNLI